MTDIVQVQTTFPTRDGASGLAHDLVAGRLAGCVQVLGPIESTYTWQGDVETAEEWLCLIKARRDDYPDVERAIRSVHPYDTPEIIATTVAAGERGYLAWLGDSTTRSDD